MRSLLFSLSVGISLAAGAWPRGVKQDDVRELPPASAPVRVEADAAKNRLIGRVSETRLVAHTGEYAAGSEKIEKDKSCFRLRKTFDVNSPSVDVRARILQIRKTSAAEVPLWSVRWDEELLTPELIEEVHGKGAKILVWTVNDAPSAWAALGRGADFVCTDRPAALWKEMLAYAHKGTFDKRRIFAWRGETAQEPEGTVAALEFARTRGFPVEFDLALTADGVLVSPGETNLKKLAGIDRPTREVKWAGELEKVDAGAFKVPSRSNPWKGKGNRFACLPDLFTRLLPGMVHRCVLRDGSDAAIASFARALGAQKAIREEDIEFVASGALRARLAKAFPRARFGEPLKVTKDPEAAFAAYGKGGRVLAASAMNLYVRMEGFGVANRVTFGKHQLSGHRGDSANFPANSLPAYRACLDNGYSVECDAWMTRDGEIVMTHDFRIGYAKPPVCVTNALWHGFLDDLSKANPGFAQCGEKFKDVGFVRLDDVLPLCPTGGRQVIFLDAKDAARRVFRDKVAAKIRAHPNVNPRNLYMQPSVVKGYKSIACKLLRRGWMEHEADMTYLMQRLRPPIVQGASMRWDDQLFTKELIDDAHAHGLVMAAWTVDDPYVALAAFGRGIDFVCTDRPNDLWREMHEIMARASFTTDLAKTIEPVPAALFGQNFEHTRAMATGGLSAELVANRKFAGKPRPNGVAQGWRPAVGGRTVFDLLSKGARCFTRHNGGGAIPRRNEINAQKITCLDANAFGGIAQDALALRRGKTYAVTVHLRGCFPEDRVRWRLRLAATGDEGKAAVLGERRLTTTGEDWQTAAFDCPAAADCEATVEIVVEGVASGVVGAVSVMPTDSFHGMRRDVIAALKEIGTSIVRWPGGNFAGDYRWRDGLLPRDERAPLQSFLESETQAYTGGYDANDIGTDEILALCDELKAEPFFTLNANWEKPESSAEWLRFCRGRVRHWSLGNEFGYGHMEGPSTPDGYAKMARSHAEALRAVDPSIRLVTSGLYPKPAYVDSWLNGSAIPLGEFSTSVSAHCYVDSSPYDFSSTARIRASLEAMEARTDEMFGQLRGLADKLPTGFTVSFDEWNFWYAWFREDGGVQGVWALGLLHRLMGSWRDLKLDCACHFQAVNEGAVKVSPRGVRLTAIGEAMRLAKGHVGGIPISEPSLPPTAFATRRADGSVYVTAFNPSVTEKLVLKFPNCANLAGERLDVADPLPGTRYCRQRVSAAGEVRLPPLSLVGLVWFRAAGTPVL